jgi:hypothetical protein
VIVRILIWSIFDSKTTIDELRDGLPPLPAPSEWIWSESGERFGIVAFGDELPDGVSWARGLIGADPDVYEEFDALTV